MRLITNIFKLTSRIFFFLRINHVFGTRSKLYLRLTIAIKKKKNGESNEVP